MSKIRAAIIEDEINNRIVLEKSLTEYIQGVEVVCFADNVKEGIKVIKDCKPDLVFLDIEIDGGTCFDILDNFKEIDFTIIFTTAYDHYAITAIKYSAFDYLLKPLDLEELEQAVFRFKEIKVNQQVNLEHLKRGIGNSKKFDSIIVSTSSEDSVIKFEDITYLAADGNYVTFHLESGKKHLATKSLSHYEAILPTDTFCRIHKSHIVNLNHVETIDSGRTGNVYLVNNIQLNFAARRKAMLKKKLHKYRLK